MGKERGHCHGYFRAISDVGCTVAGRDKVNKRCAGLRHVAVSAKSSTGTRAAPVNVRVGGHEPGPGYGRRPTTGSSHVVPQPEMMDR